MRDASSRRRSSPGTDDVISLSNVVRIQKDGWSCYRALQTKIEKRYAKGVSVLASYAWSRTLAFGNFFQDAANIDAEIAVADTDRTHNFVGSGVWELPFGRDRAIGRTWSGVADAALGGWSRARS